MNATTSATSRWFGDAFLQLHPLLQQLHIIGGTLHGDIDVFIGQGLAGVVGRKFAKKAGVTAGRHHMHVTVSNHEDGIHWARRINDGHTVLSKFEPVGTLHTGGHWWERTGAVTLKLGARIDGDSWHWQHLQTQVRGITVPPFLVPKTVASKRIVNEQYVFSVAMSLPGLGKVFGYGGTLSIE